MSGKNQKLKVNKNMLNKPLFIVNSKVAEGSDDDGIEVQLFNNEPKKVWLKIKDFKLISGHKFPSAVDQLIMYYFLMVSQRNDWQLHLTFSRYEILKECRMPTTLQYYERLEESLKRLVATRIHFNGSYTEIKGKKPSKLTMMFGYLDSYRIEEDKTIGRQRVKVRISEEYIRLIRDSMYTEILNFKHIRQLRKPVDLRMYEILTKSFYKRTEWQVDALKLADQIPMAVRYPSEAAKKFKDSVERINKVVHPVIYSVHLLKPKKGKIVIAFRCRVENMQDLLSQEESENKDRVKGRANVPDQRVLPFPLPLSMPIQPQYNLKEREMNIDPIAMLIVDQMRRGEVAELQEMKEHFPKEFQIAIRLSDDDDGNGKKE